MAMAKMNCKKCNLDIIMTSSEITIVNNLDTDEWTYTFYCPSHEGRECNPIPQNLVQAMIKTDAKTMLTRNPIPSPRVGGPPLTEKDFTEFVDALNNHDYLAAYAETS